MLLFYGRHRDQALMDSCPYFLSADRIFCRNFISVTLLANSLVFSVERIVIHGVCITSGTFEGPLRQGYSDTEGGYYVLMVPP